MASLKRVVVLVALVFAVGVPYRAMLLKDATPPILKRHAVRTEVLGCYMFLNARGQRADSGFFGAPPAVRLDSVPGEADSTRGSAWWQARALDTLGQVLPLYQPRFPPAWSADSLTDTVRIGFIGGFGGPAFAFAIPRESTDTLHGRATAYVDAGPPFEHALGPARAVRITCASADSIARVD